MFCGNCGKPLNEGALFCPECGTPVKKIETENVNVEETTASQSQSDPTPQPNNQFGQAYQTPPQPNNIPIRNYDPRFDYTPLGAWSYFLIYVTVQHSDYWIYFCNCICRWWYKSY